MQSIHLRQREYQQQQQQLLEAKPLSSKRWRGERRTQWQRRSCARAVLLVSQEHWAVSGRYRARPTTAAAAATGLALAAACLQVWSQLLQGVKGALAVPPKAVLLLCCIQARHAARLPAAAAAQTATQTATAFVSCRCRGPSTLGQLLQATVHGSQGGVWWQYHARSSQRGP